MLLRTSRLLGFKNINFILRYEIKITSYFENFLKLLKIDLFTLMTSYELIWIYLLFNNSIKISIFSALIKSIS